jgi:hypothetical protein
MGTVKHGILHGPRGRGTPALILLLFLWAAALGAEYTVRYEPLPGESSVQLLGTSNLHDWTIKGSVIQGYVDVNETCQLNPKVQELSGLDQVMASVKTHAEIPIPSLKSGHAGMDKNTYKALKSEQYPRIIYNLEQISIRTQPQPPRMTATFNAVGRLSVAGATRRMPMIVTAEPLDDKQFRVSGEIAIKMTDFGIRPPTLSERSRPEMPSLSSSLGLWTARLRCPICLAILRPPSSARRSPGWCFPIYRPPLRWRAASCPRQKRH